MPVMPRIPGKGKKIAYALLGKPANIAFKRSKTQVRLNKYLVAEETSRVR